jgi:hypothetical protein
MKLLGVIAVLAFAMLIRTTPVLAASEDVFVVPRVPVQATGENATAAKEAAQSQGRRRAMDVLLRRITPESDWGYLPSLAAGTPAKLAADGSRAPVSLSARDLDALEAGFEVYGEKASSTSYRAYITYRFKPEAVRRLLKNAKLPYSEAQTRIALVLPVLQTDKGVYLWESNNPWMAAWKVRPYTNELTPMTAPLGDLEDSSAITAQQALALNPVALAAIAARYRVSQVIVAHGRLTQRDGSNSLTVRLLNGYRETGKTVSIPGQEDDPALEEGAGEDNALAYAIEDSDFATKIGEVLAQTTLTEPSGNFPSLAEKSIESAISRYAAGWKDRTLIDHSREALIAVSAFFEKIEDWSRIRSALIATPLVGAVQVSALSRRGAEMSVRIFGDPAKVQVAMENQGIVFWTETGDRWFLATPSVASKFRGRRFLRGDRRGLADAEGGDFEAEVGPQPASAVITKE